MKFKIFNYISGLIFAGISLFFCFQQNHEICFINLLRCFFVFLLFFIFGFILAFLIYLLIVCIICLSASKKTVYSDFSKFHYNVMIFCYEYLLSLLGVKIKASGLEKININEKYVLICNHRSIFDHFIISVVLKKERFSFISKKENFNIPVFGRMANRVQYLSIPRGSPKGALETIQKAIEYVRSDNVSIGVFPEGTRSKTGDLLKFKPGCLKIAEKTNCPIVVVVMSGSEKIHKFIPFIKREVSFSVLKVYSSEEVKSLSTIEISDEAKILMSEKLNEIES